MSSNNDFLIPDVNFPPILPPGMNEVLYEENVDDRLRNLSSNVFKAYLRSRNIASYHIESYEDSIKVIFDKVSGLEIPLDDERLKIGFTDVYLEKPSVLPIVCRTNSLHYTAKLKAKAFLINNETRQRLLGREEVSLCDLPIMVRSKYCLLSERYREYEDSNDELMKIRSERAAGNTVDSTLVFELEERFKKAAKALEEVGADPADPGKYFIMDGTPRIILSTEKLRLNVPYVYMESGKTILSLSMWSPRPITSILRIVGENVTNKNDDERLYMNILLQNSIFSETTKSQINIFYVFRILGITNVDDMVKIIRRIYPTYNDPKRAAVLENLITLCTHSMIKAYGSIEDEEVFFSMVYQTMFKKHILNMYPMTKVAEALAGNEVFVNAAMMDAGVEDQEEMEEGGAAPEVQAHNIPLIKAWCQQVICLNTMSNMQLAGERRPDNENMNWYDPSDDAMINIYHPAFKREVNTRVYNFAILLVKYCLVRLGELKPSNRDSWENKRIVMTGERFATQFHHSFFRASLPDKTSKKFTTTISQEASRFWLEADDAVKESIKRGDIGVDFILNQIKIRTRSSVDAPQDYSRMTEEEKAIAQREAFRKMDKKNTVCDLVCRHDSDIIVPLVLEDYWNAFKKRGWGVRGMDSYWEKDVTDTLNVNQSDLHTYNQLCQIVVRTNDQSKNIQPRMVQESQMYFVCPVVTPEGPNVGNTKQIAVGTVVSTNHLRNDDLVTFMSVLSMPVSPGLIRRWEGNEGLCRLMYNGSFIGLCDGGKMRDFLVDMRSRGLLFRDMCIVFDDIFQLHVTTESSRLLRPVFRLNKETGRPLFLEDIEKKYITKPYIMAKDWEEMESLGYVDYIDAWEQMSGFYYTYQGVPKFIKSMNDVPESERTLEKIYKPFPTGLLIADSIWDVYGARDRARYSYNKLKLLKLVSNILENGEFTELGTVKDAMLTYAFGALETTTQEELLSVDVNMYELGKIYCRKVGFEPSETMGQGKIYQGVLRDVVKSMSMAKTNFNRNTSITEIREILLDYMNTEMNGLRKALADLTLRSRYTHAGVNPAMLYSAVALDIPYLGHIHGPRANLASKFNQQSNRGRHMNHDVLMPGEVKVLENPEVPLVVTSTSGFTGLAHHPAGQNVIVAVACFEGENQEDSLIFNRRSIEQGMFRYSRYYTETLSKDSDETGIFGTEMYHRTVGKRGDLVFGRHDVVHTKDSRYRHISRKGGLPKPGVFLNPRDCIIAAYEGDIDRSIYVKEDGAGYVDRVTVTRNFAGNPVVKVRIRQVLEPVVGDKFASRHAQKATIGRIADAEDMPYVQGTGLRPDIIINPHCLPSRQTVGQVLEMVAAKAALLKGERIVADVFQKPDIKNIVEVLRSYGYDKSGQEVLIDPKTGEKFSTKVLVGPCYYQALKHQVKFKMQSREGVGAIDTITGQPVGGRQVKGGTREGTMETAILSMADSMALHQCMVSDPYPVRVCAECGSYSAPSSCNEVICVNCKNTSNVRLTTLKVKLEQLDSRAEFTNTVVSLLLENFVSASRVENVPGVSLLIENFKTGISQDMLNQPLVVIFESLRRSLFPQAMKELLGDESEAAVAELATKIREFWDELVDRVVKYNKNYYLATVKSGVIRPVIKNEWRTTIIPQSSMVFFRYINQMGYRTRFKFSSTSDASQKFVNKPLEDEILKAVEEYVSEHPESVKMTELFSILQAKFTNVNFARGTPLWTLVNSYVKK